LAVGALASALTIILYPYQGEADDNRQRHISAAPEADDAFGIHDFLRYHNRHVHAAASRNHNRKALHNDRPKPPPTSTEIYPSGSNRAIGHSILLHSGGDEAQWNCLNALWTRESDWKTYANNPSSGAYGIPQALPGYKMASKGGDWRSNPITQIRWGISYIASKYGTACNALSHSDNYGYY
jgi:hypothetical protein